MKPSLKPAIWLAVLGVLLSLLSLFIWLDVNSPKQDMLFGKIREVNATTITITNRDDEPMTVEVSSTTEVFRGKDTTTLSALRAGDFVQIGLAQSSSTSNTAEVVRILRAPKEGKSHEPRN